MEYIAEFADKQNLGQAGNKYCGENNERAIIRSFAQAVFHAIISPLLCSVVSSVK